MADNKAKTGDNILANLVGSIILQIKPYQAPTLPGNGKGTHEDVAPAVKEDAKAPAVTMNERLPRKGIFRWIPLRSKKNGGEAVAPKQQAAMKKSA